MCGRLAPNLLFFRKAVLSTPVGETVSTRPSKLALLTSTKLAPA
jgi:hypothetical protein